MKNYLSLKHISFGKFNSYLERFSNLQRKTTLNSYRLITSFDEYSDNSNISHVGLYKNIKSNQKVIIKSLTFKHKVLKLFQLRNEASLLKVFNKYNSSMSEVYFPKFIKLITSSQNIFLIKEYISGKRMAEVNIEKRLDSLNIVHKELRTIYSKLSRDEQEGFSKRTQKYIFITYFYFLAKAIIKDYVNIFTYIKLTNIFLKSNFLTLLKSNSYSISHRDLHNDNIIINDSINIIDSEISVIAEEATDLAIILRYNFEEIDYKKFKKILIENNINYNQFLRLTIYYSVQILANEKVTDKYYLQAQKYMGFILNVLYIDNNLLNTPISIRLKKKLLVLTKFLDYFKFTYTNNLILCYHSLRNDSWYLSVSKSTFSKNINTLMKNYKLVALSELLTTNSDKLAAITFDDGYESVYKYAYPILRAKNVTATVFLVGEKENGASFGNNEKLLTKNQILELKKSGWEFGYHTANHYDLTQINNDQLIYEVNISKNALEKKLNIHLPYFAYPGGKYNRHVENVVKNSGYSYAFTVNGGSSIVQRNIFKISRAMPDKWVSKETFHLYISYYGLIIDKFVTNFIKTSDCLREFTTKAINHLYLGGKESLS